MTAYRSTGPRIVYRNPNTFSPGVSYVTLRLDDLLYVPAHAQESFRLGDKGFEKRTDQRPNMVRVLGQSTLRDIPIDRTDEYVRRPTAKALARIEAAEAAILAAKVEYAAAKKAAFTYGKTIPLSTIKRDGRPTRTGGQSG